MKENNKKKQIKKPNSNTKKPKLQRKVLHKQYRERYIDI